MDKASQERKDQGGESLKVKKTFSLGYLTIMFGSVNSKSTGKIFRKNEPEIYELVLADY